MFPDPFRHFDAFPAELFGGLVRSEKRNLPLHAWREKDALHLEFEIPGVAKDRIALDVDRGVLTLTVDRPPQEVPGRVLTSEHSYGRVTRSVALGDNFDPDAIEATLVDGVLKLLVPLSERARPRTIPISSEPLSIDSDSKLTATESSA